MAEILMLHGNGGGKTRFKPYLSYINKKELDLSVHLPSLSGFDGRAIPDSLDYWEVFVRELGACIDPSKEWVLYGHGIGGSLLLEWAFRDFILPDGSHLKPKKVILHGLIGASLHKRLFPQLMKPNWIRKSMQYLIAHPVLRPLWVRKLFRKPANVPSKVLHRFFDDYAQCAAFPIFFDLITPAWYRKVQHKLQNETYLFVWGDRERVIRSKHLNLWKKDFQKSDFIVIPDWDHFPMLEEVEDFSEKMLNFLTDE